MGTSCSSEIEEISSINAEAWLYKCSFRISFNPVKPTFESEKKKSMPTHARRRLPFDP